MGQDEQQERERAGRNRHKAPTVCGPEREAGS